jgi:hypothetical protein
LYNDFFWGRGKGGRIILTQKASTKIFMSSNHKGEIFLKVMFTSIYQD